MESHKILWNPLESLWRLSASHGVPQSPMESFKNPWNHLQVSRSRTKSHRILWNPLESLWSLSESHRIQRSPTKSHEVPWNPIESFEIPWNHLKVSRSPRESHRIFLNSFGSLRLSCSSFNPLEHMSKMTICVKFWSNHRFLRIFDAFSKSFFPLLTNNMTFDHCVWLWRTLLSASSWWSLLITC